MHQLSYFTNGIRASMIGLRYPHDAGLQFMQYLSPHLIVLCDAQSHLRVFVLLIITFAVWRLFPVSTVHAACSAVIGHALT